MTFNRSKKIAVATGMSAVAAMAVVGGTLAQFTDQDALATQILTSGTIDIAATEGAGWNTNLDSLAIGDTATRTVTLTNTSTLPIKTLHLTALTNVVTAEFGGDLTDLIEVTVTRDTDTLISAIPLQQLENDGLDLSFATNVPANTDINLTFDYSVVGAAWNPTWGDRTDFAANADNKYQGSTIDVDYTIDAIQRDGIDQPTTTTP